jgi:hypothetical protein
MFTPAARAHPHVFVDVGIDFVMDGRGRVLGVTIAEAPRRGRIYTTAPESFAPAVRGEQRADEAALGEPVTIDNYGRVADALRRDLRVAQVVCLSV